MTRSQYDRCVQSGACAAIDESACSIYDGEGWGTGRELFDPATNTWTAALSTACDYSHPRATALADGRALVLRSGGECSGEIYEIGE